MLSFPVYCQDIDKKSDKSRTSAVEMRVLRSIEEGQVGLN